MFYSAFFSFFFKNIYSVFISVSVSVCGSSVSARKADPDAPECWSSAGAASALQDQASAVPLLYSLPFPALGLKKVSFSSLVPVRFILLLLPFVFNFSAQGFPFNYFTVIFKSPVSLVRRPRHFSGLS